MKNNHQMMHVSGCQKMQPNLRTQPFAIDSSEVKEVDVLVITHIHSGHLDIYIATAVHQNCPKALFIGPKEVVKTWQCWDVLSEKTWIVEPSQEIRVNSVDVLTLKTFDRTALATSNDPENTFRGRMLQDMNELVVNYLFEIPGDAVYHAGDSHYSNLLAKHGNQYTIDVCLGAHGENPHGITDKITSVNILKVAESSNVRVVTPVRYDIWSNFAADPKEIMKIWKFKKNRLHYQSKPYIW